MYEVVDYDAMLADEMRARAHLAAMERAVRPGDVVVEIGTGVGYFAVAACRAGARHVYAIELNGAIELGPRVAAANGCADRVTFVPGNSERVTLPERGDVLFCDLRGALPLLGDSVAAIIDARTRHLRPGATLVPRCDALWAAPCEAPAHWRDVQVALGNAPYGIDRRSVAEFVREGWYHDRATPGQLCAPPVEWARLDYSTVTSPDVGGVAPWTATRAARAAGVMMWFEAELVPGVGIGNGPGATPSMYMPAFFPFARELDVEAGDRLTTEFRAKHVDDTYVFSWNTTFAPAADSGRAGDAFRQSNLAQLALDSARWRRRRDDFRPVPGRSSRRLAELLALADGTRTVGDIAVALHRAHPGDFADLRAALGYAAEQLGRLQDEEAGDTGR